MVGMALETADPQDLGGTRRGEWLSVEAVYPARRHGQDDGWRLPFGGRSVKETLDASHLRGDAATIGAARYGDMAYVHHDCRRRQKRGRRSHGIAARRGASRNPP